MQNIKFEHKKQFITLQGETISMKALLTIRGQIFVKVYESETLYRPEELSEPPENHVIFEEIKNSIDAENACIEKFNSIKIENI